MNEFYITIFISILLGYFMGKNSRIDIKDELVSKTQALKKLVEEIGEEELKVGPIRRPSAQALSKLNQDPKVLAEKQELKKSLDDIPELVEAKEKAREMKSKGLI